MPGYITIAVIIPLVITAFIMGNYTLYERTLVKYSWPWQFLVVTVVFLVQEYVITFMSYQLTDYCFYQYVIAILMYNLLNTGGVWGLHGVLDAVCSEQLLGVNGQPPGDLPKPMGRLAAVYACDRLRQPLGFAGVDDQHYDSDADFKHWGSLRYVLVERD